MATSTARTTEAWEAHLGQQIRAERIRQGVDQATLAARANISTSSLSSLENGGGARLATLIRVARALGREQWLDELAPLTDVSPLAMLRDRGKPTPRQRVTRAARAGDQATGQDTP
jgi:transcriptional regulator with XRE-family HTH domain